LELPQLEKYFQGLTDITDQIAIMNSHYESSPGDSIQEMQGFFGNLVELNWDESEKEYFDLFSSHFTFHLKIVEEIISEAREILNPENREYVKELVSYVKSAEEWFLGLKKKRKSSITAVG